MIRASAWVVMYGLLTEGFWFLGYLIGAGIAVAGSALTLH